MVSPFEVSGLFLIKRLFVHNNFFFWYCYFWFCHILRFQAEENLSFFLKFCWYLSLWFVPYLSFVKNFVFEFCHDFRVLFVSQSEFWVLSQFELFIFISFWVWRLCHNLGNWVLSKFWVLSFITILFSINFVIKKLFQKNIFVIPFFTLFFFITKLFGHCILMLDNILPLHQGHFLLQAPLQLYMTKSVHWKDQLFVSPFLPYSIDDWQ